MNEPLASYFRTIDRHAPWERGHAERVAVYATATAHALGIRGEELREVRIAAEAHDVGKMPLLVAGHEDWRRHPDLGIALLSEFSPTIHAAVRHHHERWDGSGYPDGLRGHEIPRTAQIIGLAEWFDVAFHGSPFSEARPLQAVQAELRAKAGVWFEGEVIEALLKVQRVIQPVGT
jgi:response regulator RpfG family c-di-GMP phosphodiesterase